MTEGLRIINQLEQAFQGDPWFGSSVLAVLDGVTAGQAAARPVPSAHSIWELVLHMTGWKREILARFNGAKAGAPPEGDWPELPGLSEEAWQRTLDALKQAHRDLIAAVANTTDAHLDSLVSDERKRPPGSVAATQWQTVRGILEHDIYHLGQISLLKKALRT